jgi:cytochrome c5
MKDPKRQSIGVDRLFSLVAVLSSLMWIISVGSGLAGEARQSPPAASKAAAGTQATADATSLAMADWNVLAPEAPGRDLVVSRCYVCHNLSTIVTSRGDREFWSGRITAMIVNGADIPADDVEPLVNYLSTQFGPDKVRLAVPININKASKEVLRLLPPIAPMAEAIVNAREARERFSAPEDLLTIKAITREQFKKVRPFISAQ